MAAMPMAAVSVRDTNRSDHSPYAAVSPQVSPRSAAVASASTRPSPDSISTRTDSRVTAGSYVVRRAASSTSVTIARQCGTVTSSGCWSHVIGSSRSPRSSSSRASASSCAPTMPAIAPVGGHHGRGCFSQPAASAPSTNWRSPVNGVTCRRPRAKAGSSHSLRISVHASTIWSREDDHDRSSARRVEGGAFAGARPVAEVRIELGGAGAQPLGQPRAQPGQPPAHERPADFAVGDPERPPHRALVLDRGLPRGHEQQLSQLGRVETGKRAASRAPARPRPARARPAGPAGPRRARPPGLPGRRRCAGRRPPAG